MFVRATVHLKSKMVIIKGCENLNIGTFLNRLEFKMLIHDRFVHVGGTCPSVNYESKDLIGVNSIGSKLNSLHMIGLLMSLHLFCH